MPHPNQLHDNAYFCTSLFSPLSSGLIFGCQPAATPAATMPAITVGAPNAELDRDLVDRGPLLELGVPIGVPSKGFS